MSFVRLTLAGLIGFFGISTAWAEVQNCIQITVLPAVINQQGVHCLKHDLSTNMASGAAITVNVNNVTIEMNGFKLGGLGGGANTLAYGIYALDKQNITIRNGSIRGFFYNIFLNGSGDGMANRGHVVEDLRIEGARYTGIWINGADSIIRNNTVTDTGNGAANNATGIGVQNGQGNTILDNTISRVTETTAAIGIATFNTPMAFISGNKVRNISAATTRGISLGLRSVAQGNFIANTTTGTYGIEGVGVSTACIENMVTNFTTPLDGCTLSQGNQSF